MKSIQNSYGAVTLCNLFSHLQRNIEKYFCCSCRGGVLHRATQSEQLATIYTEKALRYSLLARRSRWSVGFTKKSTHARGKLRCKLLEGCYTVQRQLQRCAQQKMMRCKLPRYPVTPRDSSATCNATVLRCKLLKKFRSVTGPLSPNNWLGARMWRIYDFSQYYKYFTWHAKMKSFTEYIQKPQVPPYLSSTKSDTTRHKTRAQISSLFMMIGFTVLHSERWAQTQTLKIWHNILWVDRNHERKNGKDINLQFWKLARTEYIEASNAPDISSSAKGLATSQVIYIQDGSLCGRLRSLRGLLLR